MSLTRRNFIKISGTGVGAAALSGPLTSCVEEFAPKDITKAKRYPTYCEVCFWKCAGWTWVNEKGRIWKITGHEDDPHSNGRLCPRGTGGVGQYYDGDRLRQPLIRTKDRGRDTFRKASWDEAIDYIAEKMKVIAQEHGPECMALFTHGSGGKFLGHMLKAYGSSNITAPSFAQCRGPREVAWYHTYGEGLGSPEPLDIRDTDCLVLIGSHLGENMHNGQVQEFADAVEKGTTIITVDPRFSTAASKSKHWLPIKPATDLALLLAWIHVLIYEDLYNKEFVEKHTFGLDQLKAHVKNMTPEWAYGLTTIKPEVIRETAREMAAAAPATIVHPGRHVTWYGDDTQRLRAVAILNALLGSWQKKGGFFRAVKKKVPKYPSPKYPEPNRNWREAFPDQFKLAYEPLANGICDATIPTAKRDCSFKGWIVNGTNLIETLPNRKQTIEAIQNLDLLVAIDTMPMEITGWADVVLPECTYLERYDMIRASPHREPTIALRMPAATPKYDSKPGWWIAKELGKKLGLDEYFPYENVEEMLDWQLKEIGSSLEEMQKIGVKKFKRKYDDMYLPVDFDMEYNTPTGKIELYSTFMAQEGYDPLPTYTAHPEPPRGFYRLIYGRAPMHTFTRTANNPNLTDLMAENNVWVNPRVARKLGLETGQEVWLQNQDGVLTNFAVKVRVTERIRWDSVYIVHGFGHSNKRLSRAYGKGVSDSMLITNVMVDPTMGGTGMRGNFVKLLTEKPQEAES